MGVTCCMATTQPVATAGALALNGSLLLFFAQRRGGLFALLAWAFHQVHLTYSAGTFAWVALFDRARRDKT